MARPYRSRQHPRVREAPPPRYAAAPTLGPVAGILLDSDVIIDALRGYRRTLTEFEELARAGIATCCCAVSWAEIFAGMRRGEEAATEAFFAGRGEIVIDSAIGRRAGAYLARFGRSHGLGIADALIAAAASTTGFHLWTLNRRDYPMDDVRFYEGPAKR